MDLDQFKTELNTKLTTDNINRSDADIEQLLTKKTSSIIDKIKKSLWFEIVFGFLINFGFVYVALDSSMYSMRIYFGVFSLVMFLFLFFLVYLVFRTNKIKSTDQTIKENLTTYISLIDEFIKRYLQFTIALIPLTFFFAGYLGYTDVHSKIATTQLQLASSMGTKTWGYFIIGFILISLIIVGLGTWGMYYFTKCYLQKLYGKYVAELKTCMNELL